ncbi:dihydrofolate reductase family protein [Euzebya tangerina]|uniref:dihydrofolate reductase family protein n=1 Tax=Euzebya tangerina TaxID=591198 RepID=UPI0013C2DE6A|nr:dihydrofolate reductase family protein [Euzebya tangerina]
MRTLSYTVAVSLDGYIARPDGDFSDFPFDDDFAAQFLQSLNRFDAIVMGRSTWEVGADQGVTNPYPFLDVDKVLVSTTMVDSPDPAVRLTADPVAEVTRMKQEAGGPIWLCGGSQLATTLLEAGLIDEIVLKHNPVLLRAGIPLLRPGGAVRHARHTGSEVHAATGIRTSSYELIAP